ncbi:MAG: ATP-dependent helicase C-terminal domain-containing protein, partial [Myxococcota bacterium]
DSGLARIARHSPWSGLPTLTTAKISRASADQRAGRAGRLGPGRCVRLYHRQDYLSRPPQEVPEIQRADLAEVVMLLYHREENPRSFPFFEAPRNEAVAQAITLLARLGAIDGDSLTEIGKVLVHLPAHPRIGRLMLGGRDAGIGRDAALGGALLSEREVRHRKPFDSPAEPDEVGPSDLSDRIERLRDAEADGLRQVSFARNDLDPSASRAVLRTEERLVRALGALTNRSDSSSPTGNEWEAALQRSLLLAYPDRVARRRGPRDRRFVLAGGGEATLSPESVVQEAEFVVAAEVSERRGKALIDRASRIEPEWLLELFAERIEDTRSIEFSEKGFGEVVSALRYDGLVLDESRRPAEGAEAEAALLDAAVARGPERFFGADALEAFRRRIAWARRSDAEIPELDQERVVTVLRECCIGARSFADLEALNCLEVLRAGYARFSSALERFAPATVSIPGVKKGVPVHYEVDRAPWIESYLQDFFGMKRGPRLEPEPLVVHLWAPNKRAVQVTSDLEGFWERHYPGLRKELGRRYPRHHWPEDPTTAMPVRLKRHLGNA